MVHAVGLHRRDTWMKALCAIFAIAMSLYIMVCFLYGSDFLGMGDRSPQAMMEATAPAPYVYRQLVPWLVHSLITLTPESAIAPITSGLHDVLWRNSFFSAMVHAKHLYLFALTALVDYLFLLGYAWVIWLLAKQLFPQSLPTQCLSVVAALMLLPVYCGRFATIYDFPELFFTALLTLVLLRKHMIQYCALLALATLNKESSVYVIAVYFLFAHTVMPREKWLFYGILQIILFATVKLALYLIYPVAINTLTTDGLTEHMKAAWDGYSVYTLLGWAGTLALLTYKIEDKPPILLRWLLLVPVMFAGWLCLGLHNDYLMFYSVFPAASLLAAHTLVALTRKQ